MSVVLAITTVVVALRCRSSSPGVATAAAAAGDVGHARRNPHPSLHYAATMATPNRQRRRNMIATVIVLLTPVVTSAASPPAAAADIGKFCQVILRQFLFSIFCFLMSNCTLSVCNLLGVE